MKRTLLIAGLIGLFQSASAHALSVKPLLDVNAEFGGDAFLTVLFTDGTTASIPSGQGLSGNAGVGVMDIFDLGPISFDAQITAGVKYTGLNYAINGSADYIRFPLELLAFVKWTRLRLGAGPTYHIANSFTGDGALAARTTNIDNALGFAMQLEFLAGEHWGLGARYVGITYHAQAPAYASVNGGNRGGNSFGGEIAYYF